MTTQISLDFSVLSRAAIENLLKKYQLNLTVDEVLTIQNALLKRPPTLAECVLWSIQGSEHCSYKSSRKHLKKFKTHGANVILGAKEDAGIVAIATDHAGYRYGLVISHESHNHPSQIVPYEGAATGVGGNVRDVCCMGAEVIAIADGLRFGDLERAKTHWIHSGVVSGIGGYGNPLGIPTIAGDTYYDAAYNDNCLVTVVTLGIVREDHIIHSYAPQKADDYVFILVGKPTDNSGFGGASFASSNLEETQVEQNKGAVQEPNAFLQRHLLKDNYRLFEILKEKNLLAKVGFKDLGAGGIACASVELAEAAGYGATIYVEKIPTGMQGLLPEVILCSETQERFMWVVSRDLVDLILTHYNHTFALPQVSQGACAAVIGEIRTDGMYVVQSQDETLVHAKAHDITQGILYDRPFVLKPLRTDEPNIPTPTDFNSTLLQLLAHENIASRAAIYETYDKQVQGRTVIEAGAADAGVITPFNEDKYPEEIRQVAVALSLDQNPRYNKIDAYWGAANAVLESIRNVVAVGATPVALTDCLCFGNPEIPEQMGEFVQAVEGIVDAARTLNLPIIAGNVSLYNESAAGAIPPSPMISCAGVIADVNRALTYNFKRPDSILLLIGERQDEGGGSVYYQLHNELGTQLPKPNFDSFAHEIKALLAAMQKSLILSLHDISDGGLAVALAEMSFKNDIGVSVDVPGILATEKKLFAETGGFILEVSRDKYKELIHEFMQLKINFSAIGRTTHEATLKMNAVIDLNISTAKSAFENGLRQRFL